MYKVNIKMYKVNIKMYKVNIKMSCKIKPVFQALCEYFGVCRILNPS